jgi:hypothetical protein
MIGIDFVAGSHGNYLEFVLNKLLLGNNMSQADPFNRIGASHLKIKQVNQPVTCKHWFKYGGYSGRNVISIRFTGNDLLPLMTVSLLRAGDMNINDKELHINTFNKLNNIYYDMVLSELRVRYCDTIIDAYNNVKADTWPAISTPEEFYTLPIHIQEECTNDFNIQVYPLTKKYPNCGKEILREFFKYGFLDSTMNGFIKEQEKMIYRHDQKVYYFPYSSFYDMDLFKNELNKVESFFNLVYTDFNVNPLHTAFLEKQPQINYKPQCEKILELVVNKIPSPIPELSLFQQSYLNARLEMTFEKEMPTNQVEYFTNTQEILDYLNEV